MKTRFDKLTDGVLSWLGLDLDIDLKAEAGRFSAITGALYLGARPGQEHVQALKDAGITHVVSCLDASERPKMAFLKPDFETLFFDLHDGVHQDAASHFPAFFDFASSAQGERSKSKLFVHCEVGVSRSATMVIALLMHRDRTRFLETYHRVRAKRPQILPNIGFASQLQRLEHADHPQAPADGGPSSLAQYLHQVCKVPVEAEVLQDMLERHDHDALSAIRAIFGDDIPRVIQGVRL